MESRRVFDLAQKYLCNDVGTKILEDFWTNKVLFLRYLCVVCKFFVYLGESDLIGSVLVGMVGKRMDFARARRNYDAMNCEFDGCFDGIFGFWQKLKEHCGVDDFTELFGSGLHAG